MIVYTHIYPMLLLYTTNVHDNIIIKYSNIKLSFIFEELSLVRNIIVCIIPLYSMKYINKDSNYNISM